jgi:hypothetical protein
MLLTAFTAIKHGKPRTNKGNNKADIKLTRKHQFSNTLARGTTLRIKRIGKNLIYLDIFTR